MQKSFKIRGWWLARLEAGTSIGPQLEGLRDNRRSKHLAIAINAQIAIHYRLDTFMCFLTIYERYMVRTEGGAFTAASRNPVVMLKNQT